MFLRLCWRAPRMMILSIRCWRPPKAGRQPLIIPTRTGALSTGSGRADLAHLVGGRGVGLMLLGLARLIGLRRQIVVGRRGAELLEMGGLGLLGLGIGLRAERSPVRGMIRGVAGIRQGRLFRRVRRL